MKKTVLFLEDFDDSLDLRGSTIVSLDPAVSYCLEEKKLPYEILENYYTEENLCGDGDAYFFDQLKWFDTFDEFFQKHIKVCRTFSISLAKANYVRLKYCIDTIFANVLIISCFFKAVRTVGVEKVVYVHRANREGKDFSIFNFVTRSRWVFGEILRLLSEKNGVLFSHYVLGAQDVEPVSVVTAQDFPPWKASFKKVLNYFKFQKFFSAFGPSRLRLLFVHAGSADVDIPIKEFIRHGETVYIKEHDMIIHENSWSRRGLPLPLLEESSIKQITDECERAATLIDHDPEIVSWISRRAGADVSEIVMPFLKNFISKDVPVMLQSALQMRTFFEHNHIDYLFARANTARESMGALIAAKYLRAAQSVCLAHASFVVDDAVDSVFDTETYDMTLARDPISESLLKDSLPRRYAANCAVFRSMHYLRHIQRSAGIPKNRRVPEKIIYVERRFANRLRFMSNMGGETHCITSI